MHRQWAPWNLVSEGHIEALQANMLFDFFATHLAPLYPIIPRRLFVPAHFPVLAAQEPFLLTTIIAIAARFSPVGSPAQNQATHETCATWIRQGIIHLLDGLPKFRTVATVEALLLLSEWPLMPFQKAMLAEDERDGDDVLGGLLQPVEQYDAFAWSYTGMAVRLAQELGLNETDLYTQNADGLTHTWVEERLLRTWLYAFNSDRHISLRRGRPAIVHQDCLTSTWWETISRLASLRSAEVRVAGEVWDDDIAQGLIAALMATIQDRVFYDTGLAVGSSGKPLWEESLEGLVDELDYIKANCQRHMAPGTVNGALFAIELEYAAVYAHTLPLRALQCKLRQGKKPKRPLLSLPEGKWIINGFNAAKAILTHATATLAPRNFLRLATGRALSRVLYATLFLFKVLALGVLPPADGWHQLSTLFAATTTALERSRADPQHLAGALAALLKRVPGLARVADGGPGMGAGMGSGEWEWDPRVGSEEAVGAMDGVVERLGGGRAAGVWGALEGRERERGAA